MIDEIDEQLRDELHQWLRGILARFSNSGEVASTAVATLVLEHLRGHEIDVVDTWKLSGDINADSLSTGVLRTATADAVGHHGSSAATYYVRIKELPGRHTILIPTAAQNSAMSRYGGGRGISLFETHGMNGTNGMMAPDPASSVAATVMSYVGGVQEHLIRQNTEFAQALQSTHEMQARMIRDLHERNIRLENDRRSQLEEVERARTALHDREQAALDAAAHRARMDKGIEAAIGILPMLAPSFAAWMAAKGNGTTPPMMTPDETAKIAAHAIAIGKKSDAPPKVVVDFAEKLTGRGTSTNVAVADDAGSVKIADVTDEMKIETASQVLMWMGTALGDLPSNLKMGLEMLPTERRDAVRELAKIGDVVRKAGAPWSAKDTTADKLKFYEMLVHALAAGFGDLPSYLRTGLEGGAVPEDRAGALKELIRTADVAATLLKERVK